jgi:biopolymer transport protein ExbD
MLRAGWTLLLIAACSDEPVITHEITIEIPERDRERPRSPDGCPDLHVRVTATTVTMVRGLNPVVVDPAGVPSAFQRFRDDCIGAVELQAHQDLPYSDVIAAMAAAKDAGFEQIRIVVGP